MEKEKICIEVLEALPEWFEIPESRASYAKESSKLFEAFYQSIGFRELECMEGLWDEANPCQVYVMAIR